MPNVWIVIPAYNESQKIEEVIQSLCVNFDYNIVVVDDGSTDGTDEIVRKYKKIVVLNHIINRGQGAALMTGSQYALNQGADVIIHFDADGQFCPQDIPKMIKPILDNKIDVVLGSRFLAGSKVIGMPKIRKLALKIAIWIDFLFSGIKLTDSHNGFRAISAKAMNLIEIKQDRMAHATEIIQEIRKHNLSYIEVPVQITYTKYSLKKGQSLYNGLQIIKDLVFASLFKK